MGIHNMGLLPRRFGRSLLVACLLAAGAGIWLCRPVDPAERFRAMTGRELPSGVRAIACNAERNDNLFLATHYWLLTGSPSAVRHVIDGTGFAPSLEDARWAAPDIQQMFGLPLSRNDVVAGYEWELDRDRWFCIFGDGTTAIYIQ
jgi:hypothetical protein